MKLQITSSRRIERGNRFSNATNIPQAEDLSRGTLRGMSESLLRTPLYSAHLAANGRMVPFAGYEMPVQYTSIIAEAKAVRSEAGMFDVSHMARLILRGESVLAFLEHVTSNDVARLTDGNGQYSLLPNATGGTVDDIIVYRIHATEYRLVVNASNHAKDVEWLNQHNSFGVEIEDITSETALIAVQGPAAVDRLASLSSQPERVQQTPAFGIFDVEIAGVAVVAARTGYTGEDGYELTCSADNATKLWDALVAAGVVPCGLGSRDTLRVEAGFPLYGHELSDDLSPISAGLGWVISKEKPFIGSEILKHHRTEGTPRKLVGLRLGAKRLITPGMPVLLGDKVVGEVSSGVVSPLLDSAIALAFVDADVPKDSAYAVEIRGKAEPATLVNKRFYTKPKVTA